MFPGLASKINLRGILRLCPASFVYHAEYLMATFPSEHPLLSTLLFAKPTFLQDLRLKLECSETSWMKASGIPPHIELYKKLDKQQQSIDALPSMLEKHMENVLELSAWRLWWFGVTRRDYPPFKGILSDDLDTSKKKATLSEW
ncbi:hypothetical protein PHMEG_0009481 [Phytophthora megakarya]|uniref:Uncharacterized protein n=1 Tax=Phytophthora megakarya TaxID=4795 RepID=A0A225WH12_9STRA|nr:hypothetical protein PHMEG_0009481 [Phytophthora megakarya]